jgi:hypothetical protein
LQRGLAEHWEIQNYEGSYGQGISISPTLKLTHLLFVDDVLIFCNELLGDDEKLNTILEIFGWVIGM